MLSRIDHSFLWVILRLVLRLSFVAFWLDFDFDGFDFLLLLAPALLQKHGILFFSFLFLFFRLIVVVVVTLSLKDGTSCWLDFLFEAAEPTLHLCQQKLRMKYLLGC